MKPEAIFELIEEGVERTNTKQVWADIGAGNGVFTHALSTLLHDGSLVYAIDSNIARMESIRVWQQVFLRKIKADFVRDPWTTEPLNGILMANSLHFVKDKESFLKNLKEKMIAGGRMIIVEYEMEKGNTWVPYPINFVRLSDLLHQVGFSSIKKLKEVQSVYEGRMIYSVVIE